LIFTGLYCHDPETEINDMAQPYRRKDNTGHPYALPLAIIKKPKPISNVTVIMILSLVLRSIPL
jgi:hypothetical protein